MTTTLQSHSSLLTRLHHQLPNAENVLPFLASYRLIPQLLHDSIVDQAIAPIHCTAEETHQACQELYQQWGLSSELQQLNWRSHYNLTLDQVTQLATRELRLKKFQQEMWGHKLESYFLKHKASYDQVIYSLLRTKDSALANELYFRIQEEEQSFSELARTYSEGQEASTGGIIGPVELNNVHPHLARLLDILPEGKVHLPVHLNGWYLIVRVEKKFPAQLDEAMRQRLLQEHFEDWFQEQLKQLSEPDQIWIGIKPATFQISQ